MKKYNNKLLAIGFSIIGIVILTIIGLSYAFFTAGVIGNENANQTVIETADLRLVFNDTDILDLDNALPGVSNSKTFTVTNIGTARQRYDINITNIINTFINDELVYTITSDNEDGGEVLETPMPTEESTLLTSSIDPGVTITYEITVKFKETGSNQNENQGATFSGKLQILPRITGVALGGYVYDENDNILPNVTVELNSDPIITTTDEEGYYEIEDAPIGIHTLYIKQGETVLGSKEITLISSEEPEIKENHMIYLPDKVMKYVNIKVEQELNIYIKEKPLLFISQIIKDNEAHSDVSIDFTKASSDSNGKGLYYTTNETIYGEDSKRIYYFRGRVENNWVSFGGYLWRIVRTTSENGVKLIYSGDAKYDYSSNIKRTVFNSARDRKYYVGYTYNTSGYIGIQTDSLIKIEVDSWYNTNLKTNENYLSSTAIYCADRSGERVDGNSYLNYPAKDRFIDNLLPSFSCSNINASRYTVSSSTGNGYLTNPIALLNADELRYSGLAWGGSLNSYIMDNATNIDWWNLSPYRYHNTNTSAEMFVVRTSGSLNSGYTNSSYYTRPAVSLKSCITVTGGNGAKANPYTLSDSNC